MANDAPVVGRAEVATDAEVRLVPNPSSALVVDELRKTRIAIVSAIQETSERRDAKPGEFHIYPQPVLTTQRIRLDQLVITCVAGAPITLAVRIGLAIRYTIRASDGTQIYPINHVADRGQQIDLIATATGVPPLITEVYDAWVVGWTE